LLDVENKTRKIYPVDYRKDLTNKMVKEYIDALFRKVFLKETVDLPE